MFVTNLTTTARQALDPLDAKTSALVLYLSKRVTRRLAGCPAMMRVSASDTAHLAAAVAAGEHTPV